MACDRLVNATGNATAVQAGLSTEIAKLFFKEECVMSMTASAAVSCPVQAINEFMDATAGEIRIERYFANFLSLIFLIMLMQLGGIPVPKGRVGHSLWGLYVALMTAQWLSIILSLVLIVATYASMWAHFRHCLQPWVGGFALLDVVAVPSFAFQPAVLTRLLLAWVYWTGIMEAIKVFAGSRRWVAEANCLGPVCRLFLYAFSRHCGMLPIGKGSTPSRIVWVGINTSSWITCRSCAAIRREDKLCYFHYRETKYKGPHEGRIFYRGLLEWSLSIEYFAFFIMLPFGFSFLCFLVSAAFLFGLILFIPLLLVNISFVCAVIQALFLLNRRLDVRDIDPSGDGWLSSIVRSKWGKQALTSAYEMLWWVGLDYDMSRTWRHSEPSISMEAQIKCEMDKLASATSMTKTAEIRKIATKLSEIWFHSTDNNNLIMIMGMFCAASLFILGPFIMCSTWVAAYAYDSNNTPSDVADVLALAYAHTFSIFRDGTFSFPSLSGMIDLAKLSSLEDIVAKLADITKVYDFDPVHFISASRSVSSVAFLLSLLKPLVSASGSIFAAMTKAHPSNLPLSVVERTTMLFMTIEKYAFGHYPGILKTLAQEQGLDQSMDSFDIKMQRFLDADIQNKQMDNVKGNSILPLVLDHAGSVSLISKKSMPVQHVDVNVLRSLRGKCPMLLGLWDDSLPVTKWLGVELGEDGRVVRLNLSQIGMTGEVPAEIGKLAALRELNLCRNNLKNWAFEFSARSEGLMALQYLDLSDNEFTSVPAELGTLTALEHLDISNNKLTSVPAELGGLTALEHLDVSNNELTSVPAELGGLTALECLDLSGNSWLTSVPAELGGIKTLRELNLKKRYCTRAEVDPLPSVFEPPEVKQLVDEGCLIHR